MKNDDRINVAIVGAGRMGATRAAAAHSLGANVVAICDENRELAEQVAGIYGSQCKAIQRATDLSWDELGAVFVCTPPIARGPVERAAVETGTAVFVEKPIAVNSKQLADLYSVLESRPTITAVGYMNRHRHSVQQARQNLGDQKVLGLSANWVCGTYGVPWWSDESQSGGPINEQATHLMDLSRFLIGEVVEVSAMPASKHAQTCAITLHFSNGAVGSIFYSCQSSEKAIRLQLFTDQQTIHLSGWEFDLIDTDCPADPPTRSREQRNEIFETEVDAFFRLIRREPSDLQLCDLADALRTQRLVDAVKKSITSGKSEPVL